MDIGEKYRTVLQYSYQMGIVYSLEPAMFMDR